MNPLGQLRVLSSLASKSTFTKSQALPALIQRSASSNTSLLNKSTHSIQDEPTLSLLRSPPKGKKFKDLVHDFNQRSNLLTEIEKIKNAPINLPESSSATMSNSSNDIVPNTRRTYEEDPNFKFERKRGKRHVMIARKLAGSSSLNQNEKPDLVVDLDISLRKPELKTVVISLPIDWKPSKSPFTKMEPKITDNDASNKQGDISVDRGGIDEFVQLYLGPLVWSNPKVDISLVYNAQSGPMIKFSNQDGGQSTSLNIGGMSRSVILKSILH